jgi:hypothetical protein
MTRSTVAVWSALAVIATLSTTLGCQATHVGDPCIPEAEYDKSFLGFSQTEVSVESKSFQCETRLCLVDHFQGRVSCPYGQEIDGGPNAPAEGCVTPATSIPVDGKDSNGVTVDSTKQALVLPQCFDRTAANAVYCSCRCANVSGQTNDGANYCKCPDGFTCTQLVPSMGMMTADQGVTGAYCVKSTAQYMPGVCTSAATTLCQASLANCGSAQGVTATP